MRPNTRWGSIPHQEQGPQLGNPSRFGLLLDMQVVTGARGASAGTPSASLLGKAELLEMLPTCDPFYGSYYGSL